MRKSGFVALLFLLAAGVAAAQEQAQDQDETRDTRPQIQVLRDPYELASFYRTGERPQGFFSGSEERYPIASYYRGRTSSTGYSRFWTNGYSNAYSNGRSQQLLTAPYAQSYRSRIGQNGDLFLFAPTFLAPVGPLTDAFFQGR
jgi:hypothetical protein